MSEQEKTRRRRHESSKEAPPLVARCQALTNAISKGVIVQANIRGTMQRLMSIKSEPTGISFLFRDGEERLCIFQVASGNTEIELLVHLPLE